MLKAMKHNPIRHFIMTVIGTACVLTSAAQTDTVAMRAMRDELRRNVEQLAIPGYPKPFFTSFMLLRGHSVNIDASLGAVVRAQSNAVSMPFVRQIVGDRRFSSEEAGIFRNTDAGNFPLESDYDLIRRWFWSASDGAYRYAISNYARRVNRVHQQNLNPDMMPDDMAPAEVTQTYIPYPYKSTEFDMARCRDYVARAAARIDSHPELTRSSVNMYGIQSEVMFLSSEGAEVVVPYNFIQLSIRASAENSDNVSFSDMLTINVPTVDDLPAEKALYERIDAFADALAELTRLPATDDDYFGPVLLEGDAVASFVDMFMTLQLINNKAPLGQSMRTADQKLGKRVASPVVNITGTPRVAEYGGTRLWGSFDVDIDGVRPADTLVLVRDGMLCALMANRVATRKVPATNGYAHFVFTQQGFGQMPAPGVLDIDVSQSYAQADAYAELIRQARNEGLEYAYIIRSFVSAGNNGKLKIPELYRIRVADGAVERCAPATLEVDNNVARRIVAASATKAAHNRTNNGVLCSYICPESMIVSEAEILPFDSPRSQPFAVPEPPRK